MIYQNCMIVILQIKSNNKVKIKHDDKIINTRCKTCTKRSKESIESLKNKYPNTFCLVNGNMDKFILFLKKGVYPYEYMNGWKKFEKTVTNTQWILLKS